MPSSLVFAALAVAWIVVLVPMVARRRQEVRRTADSALAARVLRRGDAPDRPEEVTDMADDDTYDDSYTADEPFEQRQPVERRYRPGRGGFDPQAAELAARARYAFRQRVVLALLVLALATGLLAGFAVPLLWWAHGALDAALVGYLVYLRRQVRIEQEIRQRRVDRATRGRRQRRHPDEDAVLDPQVGADHDEHHEPGMDDTHDADPDAGPGRPAEPPRQRLPQPPPHPGAAVVDLDDEDPGLYELHGAESTPYRRAAGE